MRSSLPALEKNILKYRALQMVLLLHQVESFRSFVIGSIRATDRLKAPAGQHRLPVGTKKPMEVALQVLVSEQILSESENHDIRMIIELRNKIGHTVHKLVEDITQPSWFVRRDAVYDYFALDRFEQYRRKVGRGMMKGFVLEVSLREGVFEHAEATYKEELARLRKRIDRQFQQRRAAA